MSSDKRTVFACMFSHQRGGVVVVNRRREEREASFESARFRSSPVMEYLRRFVYVCGTFPNNEFLRRKKVTKKSSHFKPKKNFLLEAKGGNKKAEDEALWWWKWRSGNKYHDWPGGHEPGRWERRRLSLPERSNDDDMFSARIAFKVDVIWKCSQ